jgi:hypothetical protein
MAAAFGPTPAETRVLASLLGGHTLAVSAGTLSIAATTANWHLENIFHLGTGVARQADPIGLATGLAPPTVTKLQIVMPRGVSVPRTRAARCLIITLKPPSYDRGGKCGILIRPGLGS